MGVEMKSREKVFTSCLISAPFGAELRNLPRVLDRLNIHWEWAKSNQALSERLPGDLRKLIRSVDFVIGVFFDGVADTNTMFEIGVAVGAGKPVLLLMSGENDLPLNLEALPHVRASLTDDKAIELHLDLLMRSAKSGVRYPASGRITSTSSQIVTNVGKRIEHEKAASAFEAEVAAVIEEAGGRVVLHPRSEDASSKFTPDMLFWLATRDAEMLNPAVVEVKRHPVTAAKLAETEQQLFGFLQQTGVRTGLIISRHVEPRSPSDFRPLLNVFVLDFEQFRQLVASGKLAEHLRRERNRAAHGLR
jgi:hypothetical protein